MELSELKQYQPLKLEVIDYDKRIQKLKSQNIVKDIVSASAAAPSFAKTSITITGIDIHNQEKISRLTQEREERLSLMNKIITYISNIDDSLVRLALRLKCCDGLEWAQIAQRIGGGNTKDSIKKQVYRYLERH